MKIRICIGFLFAALFLVTMELPAIPACPFLFELQQPDGIRFLARAYGDERNNGLETAAGYTIVLDPATGYWVYARLRPDLKLYPSTQIVGIHAPWQISKHLRAQPQDQKRNHYIRPKNTTGKALTGDFFVLTILVEFKNRRPVGTTGEDWAEKIFGASGSVKDYFAETSYRQLNIAPVQESHSSPDDGVVHVTIDMKHPNTRGSVNNKNRRITKKALQAADQYVDFSQYDRDHNGAIATDEAVFLIICSGYEGAYFNPKKPNVWGHRWSLSGEVSAPVLDGVKVADADSNGGYMQIGEWHAPKGQVGHMATIGILCHELGHDLGGLPDLYDTDYSSNGIGSWGLMGFGGWNYIIHHGDSPAHFMAWSKYFLGWIKPRILDQVDAVFPLKQIAKAKNKSLYLLGDNPNGAEYNGQGEYFLLENRQQVGYDAGLPGSGLLIWHIDESRAGNSYDKRRLVDLEEADGKDDLDETLNRGDDGDPYPGYSNKKIFTPSSYPNSNWYQGSTKGISITRISRSKRKMTLRIYKK